MSLSDIKALAAAFRSAIEATPRSALPVTFESFPAGACGDAVLLLAKYLQANGHDGFVYTLGIREDASHAWLSRNNLVVDITADQFDDQVSPVIVETNSAWHTQFRINLEHKADYEIYDRATVAVLASAYRQVIKNLHCV